MRSFGFHTILMLFCLLLMPQATLALTKDAKIVVQALKQAEQGNWSVARRSVRSISDLAAKETFNWYAYTKGAPNTSFKEISNFILRHPEWPYLDKMRLEAEKRLTDNVSDITLIKWFSRNEPITAKAMDRYAHALIARGKGNDAKRVLKNWWKDAPLTRNQQRDFFSRYGRYLDRSSHFDRMNTLLHKKKYDNAFGMANVLGGGYPALAEARKALAQNSKNVNPLIAKVPINLRRDEGLQFERLRWRRKNNLDSGAIEILNQAPKASRMYAPKSWWRERHIIARRLIEKKRYKQAYRLVSSHKQREGFPMAQAEWVSGLLALRFVNEPWKAFEHFETLYKNVKSPISRARGAYWAGRASAALKHSNIAAQWYNVGARHPETFYGQLSAAQLNRKGVFPKDRNVVVSSRARAQYKRKNLVKAAKFLNDAGLRKDASLFLLRLSKNAQAPSDYILTADLANSLGQQHIVIKTAQMLQKEKGISESKYLYPPVGKGLKYVKNVEWAFVSAIIRQESRFDHTAVSHAGARGLMQLMPATAKGVARRNGIRHQTSWLTSRPSHNISLGSRYLGQMVNRFDGNYAMAAAAYNAGPGRVDRWLKEFGDPRRGQIDLIDWIELIPIYETRNYVQRVLEGVYVYRNRLKGKQARPTKPIHVAAK